MLNDNYTAFCVNRNLLQCWRGLQNTSSLYQGIAQCLFRRGLTVQSSEPPKNLRTSAANILSTCLPSRVLASPPRAVSL